MRRWRLAALLLALLAGGLWLTGRPPSESYLKNATRAYHEERVKTYVRAERIRGVREGRIAEITKLLQDATPQEQEQLRTRRGQLEKERQEQQEILEALLRSHKRVAAGGWTVLMVPAGADPPAREGFARVTSVRPAGPHDPGPLKRPMEIWCRADSWPARLCATLGLRP